MFFLTLTTILLISCSKAANKVCYEDNCFDVELAITPEEKMTGLMFREHLDKDKGMLFIYDEECLNSFWMKNTLIPLDMIFIDKDNIVVNISKDVKPCKKDPCERISPKEESAYVLELNAGTSEKIGLNVSKNLEIFISP